ncbi:MAG: hypothetical protein D6712_16975 [Chloroflexi bacterium]|nr:MAG: hypothetical protein D6712_16975 [Chloroflexota bacterium]
MTEQSSVVKTEEFPGMTYTLWENGIHEFAFNPETDGEGDYFFPLLTDILRNTDPEGVNLYIIDSRHAEGNVSMRNLVRRFRQLDVQIPHRAAGRTAVLQPPSLMVQLADLLVSTLAPGKDKTRFFGDKRDEAVAWLLEEKRKFEEQRNR